MRWNIAAMIVVIGACLAGCRTTPATTQAKPTDHAAPLAPGEKHAMRPMSGHSGIIEGFAVDGKSGAVSMRIISAGPEGLRNYRLWVQGSGTDKDWHLHCSEPQLELLEGWCVVTGSRPMARTTRVFATGSGTTFVLQIDGNIHRVYQLPDSPLGTVTLTTASMQSELNTARTFRDVIAKDTQISQAYNLDERNPDGSYVYPVLRTFIDDTVMPALEQIRDR